MSNKTHDEIPVSMGSTQPNQSCEKMHAICWRGKLDMKYEEVPRPALTHPQDVLVRVTATTVCGSDLHLYTGDVAAMKSGDIVGHEFMGIIEQVGNQVKDRQIGQRVVVAFDIADGTCDYCKREEYTACDTTNSSKAMQDMYNTRCAGLFGYSHLTGAIPGGQAEYVRVPFADVNTLPIPEDVPDEKALYLSDVIPTALHACEIGTVREGCTVGIWGLGPIGLLCARWCQIKKAAKIYCIDEVPERLQKAQSLGQGIVLINFKENDVVKTLNELCPGGLDVAIDAAGFRYTESMMHKVERAIGMETDACDNLTQCILALRKCGNLSIIADYLGFTNHFPIGHLMEKGITVRGGQSPTQKYWKYCLKMLQSGEFDPTFIVTHHLKLSDAPNVYNTFHKKEDGMIKVFLRP